MTSRGGRATTDSRQPQTDRSAREDVHLRDAVDMSSKRHEWRWERIGWVLIALIVLAAVAGLFGGGPLSKRTVSAALAGGTAEVEYERWNRMNHVSILVVRVHAPGAQGEDLNLTLSHEVAESWTIRSSAPSAEGGVGPDGILYAFPADDWSQPVTVSLEYLPERAGHQQPSAVIDVGGGEAVSLVLDQFVYP